MLCVRYRAFEVKLRSRPWASAESEDAVDVRCLEFLAELMEVATDRASQFQGLAAQLPELIPMAQEPLSGLR